jgi:hypothetical protein
MKDYIPLLAATISGIILIAVAIFGAWVGRRNEHYKWLREERLQTYTEWLNTQSELQIICEEQKKILLSLKATNERVDEISRKQISPSILTQETEEQLSTIHTELLQAKKRVSEEAELLRKSIEDLRRISLTLSNMRHKIDILGSKRTQTIASQISQITQKVAGATIDELLPQWVQKRAAFIESIKKELGLG